MSDVDEVLVCDRWPLLLGGGDGGYYEYINKRAGEVGRNAYCIRWLLEQLPREIETVVEPFGGVGVFATVIQGMCQPKSHRIFEIDSDCLRQLQVAFRGKSGVTIAHGDAYETIGRFDADLYMLDFPFFTALHFDEWHEQLKRMFARRPGAVIWMDGASFGMHWHAARYARLLNRTILTNREYAIAISEHVYHEHGYSIKAATVSRGCFYFAFTRGPVGNFSLHPFSTEGRALRPSGPTPQKVRIT